MTTPTVDVVIPTHNHWELTERCLASLARRDPCVRRVIVVDDASSDETPRRLRERTDVESVLLDRNVGFSAACNAGARRSDAEAVFFLNNDTVVDPGTIELLARTIGEPGIGAVMPKLVNGDGTLQCAGLALLSGETRFTRLHAYLDADAPEGNAAYDPIGLSGAALLVRRDAFLAAGLFDERYRNGFEDVDLCATLWSRGYRCRYEPRAVVMHLEGASRGKILDDAANERHFAERWGTRLDGVPRWKEPPAPVLALSWRASTPLEATVAAHLTRTLSAYAGARVVRSAAIAPLLAALDRRPLVRVHHRAGGRCDVAWCAPIDGVEARAAAERRAARYWVPSDRAASLLHEAGIEPRRVSVVRLGWSASGGHPESESPLTLVVVAGRRGAGEKLIAALGGNLRDLVLAETIDTAALARITTADVVVFADDGDRWCAAGTAALAAGALVIAPGSAPFLEVVPPDLYVRAETPDAIDAAIAHARSDPLGTRQRGALAARMMARAVPDVHTGRRVRELARAIVHPVVDARTLAVDAEVAASLGTPQQ